MPPTPRRPVKVGPAAAVKEDGVTGADDAARNSAPVPTPIQVKIPITGQAIVINVRIYYSSDAQSEGLCHTT